jgi:polyadenylate-binding protein
MSADTATNTIADDATAAAATTLPATTGASSNASLYVGELDPSVTEAMLFELFNMIGHVASIRVCRDAVTRRSLGYAYVNYHNRADAERALDSLNYTPIKGRPCRIMWSQRDPALRKTGAGNIFIKNLDPSIDHKVLHDTFSAFGNILSCKVAMENGVSRGYGFVHYESQEAAEAAINAVNGMLLNDKKVYVGLHVAKKERESKAEEMKKNFTNVYVKNLDPSVTLDQFREMFEKYGPITSAVIATDSETNVSKGFGFVNFEQHEDAEKACDEMNEQEIQGRKLYVGRAQKKAEREEELKHQYETAKVERMNQYQGINLYIKNLDEDVDDEILRREFEPYGEITSAKVMREDGPNGKSKGFGFVCFTTQEEATKALAEMNGKIILNKSIFVTLALRKEQRKSQLEAQMAQRNQMRMQAGVIPGGPGVMPGAPMYPGAPMFYAPGGFPAAPGRGVMGYPHGMVPPRPPRWTGNGQPPQQVPVAGGMPGQFPAYPNAGRGGRGGRGGARGGMPGQPGRGGPVPAIPGRGGPAANRPPPQKVTVAKAPGLTAAALAAAPPEMQKQMLGEALFPLIAQRQPEQAGKITGMLLEMDNSELLHLLESPEALDSKVEEAVTVLKQHAAVAGKPE